MSISMLKMRFVLMAALLLTVSTASCTPLSSLVLSRHKEVVMGNSNGIITAPINLETDVYKVLGIGKQGGFYDTGYACSNVHGKINPYAKFKPIKSGSQGTDLHINNNWRGDDGLCGFNIPVYDSLGGLISGMLAGVSFSYNPPVPSVDFCRIEDFIGYNHNVSKGFFGTPNLGGNVILDDNRRAFISVLSNNPYDPGSDYISFADLAPVQQITGDFFSVMDMYPAVLFYRSNNDQFYAVSENKLSESSGDIEISFTVPPGYENTVYTYYLFLCQDRNMSPNTVFLPTDIAPSTVMFLPYAGGVEATMYIRSINDYDGDFTIEYWNRDNKPVSFNGATATLYDDNTGEQLEYQSILNAFTLAAHEKKVVEFTFSFDFDGYQNPDMESSYVLSVRAVPSRGGNDLVVDALFDRYSDGSWYDK